MLALYDKVNDYSLTNDLFLKFTNKNMETSKINEKEAKKPQTKKEKERYIVPTQKDKLFWCFYIFYKGLDDYINIKNNHFSIEKQMKIEFVDIIRNNKPLLKFYNLKRNDIENQLVNESVIEKNLFFLMCIYYDINVMIVNNVFYYEIDNNSENINVVSLINGSYCVDTNTENVDFYRLNYCKMDNLNRYVKPMSGYKLPELQNICLKLNISINYDSSDKTKKKSDLYEDILLLIQSIN
tara:strand:+ start:11793 stop:12509 length:717 start_codon:yes stop_codon:yes gene_type:complete